MTDREMLMIAYGAMKALAAKGNGYSANLSEIVDILEHHICPQPPPAPTSIDDEIHGSDV